MKNTINHTNDNTGNISAFTTRSATMMRKARPAASRSNGRTHRTHATRPPLLICAALLLGSVAGFAQETDGPRYGLFGAAGFVNHRADFPRVPGTQSCCLSFNGGSGFGLGGGGLLEWQTGRVLLGARVGAMTHPFDMTTEEGTFIITEGTGADGSFHHRLTGSYLTVGIEPTIGLRLFGGAIASVGVQVGMPVSGTYEQYEQLTSPTAGTFMNADGTDSQRRTRNEYEGDLPGMKLRIAPLASVGYELPMNADGTLLLVPEVSYQLGLTDVIDGADWKTDVLRAGVAVKFGPGRADVVSEPIVRREEVRLIDTVRREVPALARAYARGEETRSEKRRTDIAAGVEFVTETIRRTDTLFTQKPSTPVATPMSAEIAAVSVGADGVERPLVRMTVEEFSSTLMTPLLPYVFFDENSSDIPNRYARLTAASARSFDIDAVNSPETLPTYYHLLNIVGRRMTDNPAARLTLTGANQDRDAEKGRTDLSRSRAENVKAYLVDVWGIDERRIEVRERNLPEKAASTVTDDGAAENRRVEFASDDPAILFPIITRDTLRRVDPPLVTFRPVVSADAGITSWEVSASQNGTTLKSFDGSGDIPEALEWNLARQASTVPLASAPLEFRLNATDGSGATAGGSGTLDVEQITIRRKQSEGREDVQVDRFSLILFDVRSAELNGTHDPIVELIGGHIRRNSAVTVTGFTDRLGDAAYNAKLADARAASVSGALGHRSTKSVGVGEADLFNSDLPEARLYTRTVEVVVETPVE